MSRASLRAAVPALLGLGVLALLGACYVPARRPPLAPAAPPAPVARARPAPAVLTGTVSVRLAAYDGSARVRIEGAPDGPLVLERAGDAVASGAGERTARPVGARRVVEPGPEGELRVEGRPYPGRVLVEVRPEGGLRVVNQVGLEAYVRGVVTSEIPVWSAPPAMLEAQAIAARTYALRALADRGGAEAGAFLWDTTFDQAYRGSEVVETLPDEIRLRLERALEATRGLVLTHRGELLDALFHAACGGTTADLTGVFGRRAQAPLQPVRCAACRLENAERGGQPSWSWTASAEELGALARRLGLGERLVTLQPVRVDEHGRWLDVELTGSSGHQRLSARELRSLLGPAHLKSARIVGTWPPVGEEIRKGLLFEGIGRGHGVGLCQTGALGLAREGATARQILSHYYPGAVVLDWRSLPGSRS